MAATRGLLLSFSVSRFSFFFLPAPAPCPGRPHCIPAAGLAARATRYAPLRSGGRKRKPWRRRMRGRARAAPVHFRTTP
ncbi:hypothetical protein AVXHC21_10750 [Acidovorax sacchari]